MGDFALGKCLDWDRLKCNKCNADEEMLALLIVDEVPVLLCEECSCLLLCFGSKNHKNKHSC